MLVGKPFRVRQDISTILRQNTKRGSVEASHATIKNSQLPSELQQLY